MHDPADIAEGNSAREPGPAASSIAFIYTDGRCLTAKKNSA
jgi:hypothetical protein